MIRTTLALVCMLSLTACGATKAARPGRPAERPSAPAPSAAPKDPEAFRNDRPQPLPLAEIHFPAVERARLESGLTLYVLPRPAGLVTMSLVARGGASSVPAGKSGLAALTVRMMTEGTTRRGSLALAEAVESLGTTLEHSAGRDFVRLGLTTRKEDFARGLGLLAEVIQTPAFAKAELERVRGEWLDGIESERQSPARLSALVGLRLLLGPDRGAPVSGSRHDVRALSRQDLVEFHRTAFAADEAALVVVGDVSMAEARAEASRLFQSLPHPGTPKAAPQGPPPGSPGPRLVLVDRPGAVQSAIFVVQPFPRRDAPGYEARELLTALFGGFFTSRLNMNLREEHAYTYGARSLDMATRSWGAFALMTSVETQVTAPALEEAMKELGRAADPKLGRPIAEQEVAMARVDRKQDLGSTLADTAEVAARVEDLFVHHLADDYYHNYPALLDGVDAAAVAEQARSLDPSRAITVIVGDRKSVEPSLGGRKVEIATQDLTD